MIEVQADKTQNVLKISFSGHVGPAEAEKSLEKIRLLLATVRPGFRLLTDLSRLDSMDPACAPFIRRTMDLCNDARVAEVVRVIPDPEKDIGLNILSLFHYRRGLRIVTFETMEEALNLPWPEKPKA